MQLTGWWSNTLLVHGFLGEASLLLTGSVERLSQYLYSDYIDTCVVRVTEAIGGTSFACTPGVSLENCGSVSRYLLEQHFSDALIYRFKLIQ